MLQLLDLHGICISTGSACTSREIVPSHVLTAMGLSNEDANNSIRLTYGKNNTIEEVKQIVDTICSIYDKILSV